MRDEIDPRHLEWDDVDPARHPFDKGTVSEVVRGLGPARTVPTRDREAGRPWADAMTWALREEYGRWVAGWRWALDEGDFDGGPVGSWCCAAHSMTSPDETLQRVVAGVVEWREWLESLAGWFEAYPLDPGDVEEQRVLWECAVRKLILHVVDRTGAGSGWHGHCRQVLRWFLGRWGVPPALARELVDDAVGGRFTSWTGPDAVLVDDVAERVAGSLRADDVRGPEADGAPPDHLALWLAVREATPWEEAPPDRTPVSPGTDGAVEDVRAFDGALDPGRAQGLLAALAVVRADAARGVPLDFELLRRWQRHVLGTAEPPGFRTLPAFAKRGRERYGIAPGTRALLDACLAESARDDARALPLASRAARAYLDVCFFHPFDDGNARAAFLTLVFVLAREGVGLERVGPLRRVSFRADDGLMLAGWIGSGTG
ncbi:Fic family protein [Streptomyces roseirectus]|uniref:Fic family protein n=1 Tax=Streptomyces roseirectus TaxID=2768066 RepID=A0A7H0I7F4_9ACTN|nr:Fic family protein [Streptomyces roseirectus]QNP68720.1 Fic family protein [Streptomyces roseirectus]